MSKYVLLVEGQTDIDFLAALLRKENMLSKVEIKPPRGYGFSKDTVTYFPEVLKLLIKQFPTGQIQNLGIIADADYVSGGGFGNRWKTLTQPLKDNGYHIPNPPKRSSLGNILRHPTGLPPVGLWIMPDHKSDGMLEDFIENARIRSKEQDLLFKYAKDCIKGLPYRLFSDYQETKAAIYSWLAWQERPGLTLDVTINAGLVDMDSPRMKKFRDWLHRTFP